MSQVEYVITTRSGTPMLTFDTEHRARTELQRVRARSAKEAKLVRVTRVVEELVG